MDDYVLTNRWRNRRGAVGQSKQFRRSVSNAVELPASRAWTALYTAWPLRVAVTVKSPHAKFYPTAPRQQYFASAPRTLRHVAGDVLIGRGRQDTYAFRRGTDAVAEHGGSRRMYPASRIAEPDPRRMLGAGCSGSGCLVLVLSRFWVLGALPLPSFVTSHLSHPRTRRTLAPLSSKTLSASFHRKSSSSRVVCRSVEHLVGREHAILDAACEVWDATGFDEGTILRRHD